MKSLLNVLIRVGRHSLSSASAVVACDGLLHAVFDLFINPSALLVPTPAGAEGAATLACRRACTGLALKLVRVLSSSGRTVARETIGAGRMGRLSAYVVDPLGAYVAHAVSSHHAAFPLHSLVSSRHEASLIHSLVFTYFDVNPIEI